MLKWICLGSAILTWSLIPFGAFVRLKNAGISCPDWPLCYGQFFPPPGFEIALETGHRFVAMLLGILIITITFLTFRKSPYSRYRKLAVTSLILVCVQGILGALTVTMLLWPPVVTLHLLGGNMLFGILVYLARVNFLENVEYSSDSYNINTKAGIESRLKRRHIVWMLAVLFIVIASGGYNSTTSSGAHCEAFPGCHEGSPFSFGMSGTDISEWTGIEENILLPAPQDFQGRFFPEYKNEWIHMIHRLIAVLGGIVLIIMAWAGLKNRYGHSSIGLGIVGLILLEFCVGILNAIFRVPAPISATHTAIAATLTGLMFLAAAERNQNLVKE